MHSFEVHSNESACRKNGCLGMEQVQRGNTNFDYLYAQIVAISMSGAV